MVLLSALVRGLFLQWTAVTAETRRIKGLRITDCWKLVPKMNLYSPPTAQIASWRGDGKNTRIGRAAEECFLQGKIWPLHSSTLSSSDIGTRSVQDQACQHGHRTRGSHVDSSLPEAVIQLMVARQERDIFFSCVADKVLLKDNPSPMLLKGRGWGREERKREAGMLRNRIFV